MPLTRTTLLRIIKISTGVLLALLVIGYAIWGSLNYARGPAIEISSPANNSAVNSNVAVITGRADRVNSLSLNGDPISMDEQGNFSQTVVIFPGMNKLTFVAHDQFKRTAVKELDLVGTMDFPVNNKTVSNNSTSTSTQ